jgi:predicted O-methyltransferase YrrM
MAMESHHLTYFMKYRIFVRFPSKVNDVLRDIVRSILVEGVISRIRKLERHCRTLDDYFDLIQGFGGPLVPIGLSSGQRKKEILRLLDGASRLGLRTVVEIGTCRGGTFYLLCKASTGNASVLTMDITMPRWRKRLLRSFARSSQSLILVRGDSHSRKTIKEVKESLRSEIDLLFIDGDHSYNGVKKDFINYSPLVRKRGWIAFHDINSAGPKSDWTGGVPDFWNEVKRAHEHCEIIENRRKGGGCGIGVLLK